MAAASDEGRLRELFQLTDADGGGRIELSEVRQLTDSLAEGSRPSAPDLERLVSECGDGGEVDEQGFLRVVEGLVGLTGLSVPDMIAAFTSACYKELFQAVKGRRGTVGRNDCRRLIESVMEATPEDILRVFNEHDADCSGEVDFEEFEGIVQRLRRSTDLSISVIKTRFLDDVRRAQERTKGLRGMFDGGGTAAERPPSTPSRSPSAPELPPPRQPSAAQCAQCAALESEAAAARADAAAAAEEVKRLRAAVEKAEAEAAAAARRADEAAESKRELQKAEQQLKLLRRAAGPKKGDADKLRRQVEQLTEQLDDRTAQLGRMQAELQKATMPAAQAQGQAERGEGQAGRSEEQALLEAQVWTLQTALELRNAEIARLTALAEAVSRQLEAVDPALAADVSRRLSAAQAEGGAAERSAFGGRSAAEALAAAAPSPPPEGADLWALEAALAIRGREIDRLTALLQQLMSTLPPDTAAQLQTQLADAKRATAQQERSVRQSAAAKRRPRRTSGSSLAGSLAAEGVHLPDRDAEDAERLRAEVRELRRRLAEGAGHREAEQRGLGGRAATAAEQRGLGGRAATVAQLPRAQRPAEDAELRLQLSKAQAAIMAGADRADVLESKLRRQEAKLRTAKEALRLLTGDADSDRRVVATACDPIAAPPPRRTAAARTRSADCSPYQPPQRSAGCSPYYQPPQRSATAAHAAAAALSPPPRSATACPLTSPPRARFRPQRSVQPLW